MFFLLSLYLKWLQVSPKHSLVRALDVLFLLSSQFRLQSKDFSMIFVAFSWQHLANGSHYQDDGIKISVILGNPTCLPDKPQPFWSYHRRFLLKYTSCFLQLRSLGTVPEPQQSLSSVKYLNAPLVTIFGFINGENKKKYLKKCAF